MREKNAMRFTQVLQNLTEEKAGCGSVCLKLFNLWGPKWYEYQEGWSPGGRETFDGWPNEMRAHISEAEGRQFHHGGCSAEASHWKVSNPNGCAHWSCHVSSTNFLCGEDQPAFLAKLPPRNLLVIWVPMFSEDAMLWGTRSMRLYVVQRAIRKGWVMNVLAKSGHIFIELVCVSEHHWFAMQTAFRYCCNSKDGS